MNESLLVITQIEWRYIASNPEDNVRGMCSIVVNGQLVIREILVVRGWKNLYVAYPKKQSAHPISERLRRRWEHDILRSYAEYTSI